ncbi:MAG: hypothetical protein JWR16_1189 [Nevskia sp.]|nr:hypothetical protein [Nevskia sp.]
MKLATVLIFATLLPLTSCIVPDHRRDEPQREHRDDHDHDHDHDRDHCDHDGHCEHEH